MKKYFITLLILCTATISRAQGFSSFSVEGSLQPAIIKNVSVGASVIDVLVDENVELKNMVVKYKLLNACNLANEISKDFTQAQKVVVVKNDGTSKEWIITVKKLIPASVPFELVFSDKNPSTWTPVTIGWAGIGIDAAKSTVIRFGNSGVSFWVALKEAATKVNYQLEMVSKEKIAFSGDFVVEASTDGRIWDTLAEFNESNPFPSNGSNSQTISKDIRFIRWSYLTRNKLNLNLNNIYVTAE